MADIVDPFDSGEIVDPFESAVPAGLRPKRDGPRTKLSLKDEAWLRKQRPSILDRIAAGGRSATRALFPTATGTAGAATGAGIGAMTGPFAEFGVPAGFVIGGVLGSLAGEKAQEGALQLAPKVAKTFGQNPEQVAQDRSRYPVTTAAASFVPALVGGNAMQRTMTPKGSAAEAFLPQPSTKARVRNEEMERLNATRRAAERQGVTLPTTLTSPTGYRTSRMIPNVVGTKVIDRAESVAPEAVGRRLEEMATRYGKPTERGSAGQLLQESAARKLEALRKSGSDKIEEANTLAKGVRLEPVDTVDFLDKTIEEMSVNSSANAPFIKWLAGIKGDLSNPDNPLDVGSLRDLRHSLYRQTSPEGIAAGDKARLAGELWTRLSGDIRAGLTVAADQGNPNAAKALEAFDEGSATWAKRKSLYDKALKKVIGANFAEDLSDPSNPIMVADKPPEAAWDAVRNMTANDRRAFQKTMSSLDPSAQDTVRASIIASLGRGDSGEFVPAKFLSDMHKMAPQTRIALFGKETVSAMDDLQTIVRNIKQVEPREGGWGQYAAPGALAGLLGITGGATGAGAGFLGVVGTSAGAAHILSRPDSLRWLARLASSSRKGVEAFNETKAALGKASQSRANLVPLYQLMENPPQGAPKEEGGAEDKPFDPSALSDEELNDMLGGVSMNGAPEDRHAQPSAEMVSFDPSDLGEKPFEELIPAVVHTESSGDPDAVSPKGAEGLMQVMPETQRDPGFGIEPSEGTRDDTVRVGVDYLKKMVDRYPSQALALMAYNWGPGNVDKWVAGGMKGPVPKETRDYVQRILGKT